jgi:hypothetical protein
LNSRRLSFHLVVNYSNERENKSFSRFVLLFARLKVAEQIAPDSRRKIIRRGTSKKEKRRTLISPFTTERKYEHAYNQSGDFFVMPVLSNMHEGKFIFCEFCATRSVKAFSVRLD